MPTSKKTAQKKPTKSLADFVRQYCRHHEISISQLANHANIARSTLYNIMDDTNNKSPTLINLTKLAIAMQVHPQFLIELEWQRYKLAGTLATPINPLQEPERWFTALADNAYFVSETIPDGSLVRVNEVFIKTWRLQNTGNTPWINRKLVCQNMGSCIQENPLLKKFTTDRTFYLKPTLSEVSIPITYPGKTVDIQVEFTAPNVPSTAFSYWKMVDENNEICFPNCIGVYAHVHVVSANCANNIDLQ